MAIPLTLAALRYTKLGTPNKVASPFLPSPPTWFLRVAIFGVSGQFEGNKRPREHHLRVPCHPAPVPFARCVVLSILSHRLVSLVVVVGVGQVAHLRTWTDELKELHELSKAQALGLHQKEALAVAGGREVSPLGG